MKNATSIALAIAGASVAAFIMSELEVKSSWGWSPSTNSAIYLVLLSIAVAVIGYRK